MTSCKGVLNTVGEAAMARRKSVKKRRLFVLNEHFIRFAVRFAAVLKHIQPRDCEQIFSPALPNFQQLKTEMAQPLILDGRNIYEPSYVRASGFTYYGVGR